MKKRLIVVILMLLALVATGCSSQSTAKRELVSAILIRILSF